ncbi:lysophospholipid acyltransferase family protein [Facklamia lactis]|uniref:lysophospholipid acyltransferase family protein n=1 Tax=Facklamia lactis TaxID=2749967 RepID=UPI0018CE3903|nr:1-acyl-sn-glycerol-3-phosphate acyltransferase [Facklamia lactis]MBG9980083.1 1-acyl-sn-glycerol-3-phosphate acyltransferase [Facklamia lactis]
MTFYQFAIRILQFIFRLFNGKSYVIGLENLPQDDTYILAATHRSYLDPFYIVINLFPEEFSFMAKESLFNNFILNKLLRKAYVFPVNREKPSPKTIKHGVKQMTENQLNLGIFPSGSRYSTQVKSGTAFIQRLSKKAIVPVAIQPPLTTGQFFQRKKAKIAIGEPIIYDESANYDKAKLAEIDHQIAQAFDNLDQQLDPSYHYIPPTKK